MNLRRALFVMLLLPACAGVPFPTVRPSPDEVALHSLIRDLTAPPAEARTVQRWVLATRGVEVFFTVYLRVTPPERLDLAVLSDMGQTLCQATLEKGAVTVSRESRLLDAGRAEGLLRDVAPLFLAPERARYRIVRRPEGTPGLLWRAGARTCLLERDGDGSVLHTGEEGDLLTIARISARSPDGLPRAFVLESLPGEYVATVDVAAPR